MKVSKNREINQLSRDLRKIQGGNALNVLFLLDQTLKKLEPSKQKDLEKIADTIILCINKLAPGKASTMEKISNDWINNKLKNEITKKTICIKIGQNGIYKSHRNMVTTFKKCQTSKQSR